MLYRRSSFIRWLTKTKGCEVYPVNRTNIMIIENGLASAKMWVNPRDVIDYEEIHLLCQKLYVDLPGDKDLIKVE